MLSIPVKVVGRACLVINLELRLLPSKAARRGSKQGFQSAAAWSLAAAENPAKLLPIEAPGNFNRCCSITLTHSLATRSVSRALPSSFPLSLSPKFFSHDNRPPTHQPSTAASDAAEKMDPNEQPPASPPSAPDAPDQETMEQIRQRRLAKLGGAPGSGTPPASPSRAGTPPVPGVSSSTPAENNAVKPPAPAESSRPKITIKPAPAATPQSTDSASSSRPGIANRTESGGKRRASDVDGPSATAPPKKQPAVQESLEDYADRMFTSIFRVTVDPKSTADIHGHKLTFLPILSQELSDEGLPLKLPADRLDEALMEASSGFPHQKPLFEFLLPCWKRVGRALKSLRGPAPQKETLLKEARRLCFSNCIFALTVPELYGYVLLSNPLFECRC